MAKKTKSKSARKVATRTRSASYDNHHEQNTFLLIAGGGLLVLILIVLTLGSFTRSSVDKVKEEVVKKVENVKAQEEQAVMIRDMAFSPEKLEVKVGTTVTFTNEDTTTHSVVADDQNFDTGLLAKGEKGTVTFSKEGTYTYHCAMHPDMTGTVVVEE